MKRNTLKKLLVLTFVVVAVVVIADKNQTCVSGKTCEEAAADWSDANITYTQSRMSYFQGYPMSCATECASQQNYPGGNAACIADCNNRRRNTLNTAEIDLLSKAYVTCSPYTIEECAAARAAADQCLLDYPFTGYADPEEGLSIYSQYSACRLASKVDSCQ